MKWFSCEREIRQWAGPEFRYPFIQQSFESDLKLDSLASYSLLNRQGLLIGFGQYYPWLGRCHLSRLVINPDSRGQGIIQLLLTSLLKKGLHDCGLTEASLFVFENNASAINAYLNAHFEVMEYPDAQLMEHCLYMVKIPN